MLIHSMFEHRRLSIVRVRPSRRSVTIITTKKKPIPHMQAQEQRHLFHRCVAALPARSGLLP